MRERIKDITLRLALPLGVGLVMGVIGPFGTYDLLPLAPRLGYWLAVISLNWALADTGIRRLDELVTWHLPARRILMPLLGALVVSVPATGVVVLANGLSGMGWPEDLIVLYGKVLILLAALALPVYIWEDQREARSGVGFEAGAPARIAEPQSAHPESTGLNLFLARLPRPLPGRLLCLEMQDHYLVVHTTGGTEMLLCRMEDAARELDGIGYRVHRSWWVAEDAIVSTSRTGQRQFLVLSDGRSVPVGRAYKAGIRKAGLL